ncbi:MAG TPA: hypothetical protein VEM37_03100 [Nitrospiraceae bacterium]|nr:hypothetical protein [Nitrospiraceae bacterium]
MAGPRRDVLTAIGTWLTAAVSANLFLFLSPDSPHDVHVIDSEGGCGHG